MYVCIVGQKASHGGGTKMYGKGPVINATFCNCIISRPKNSTGYLNREIQVRETKELRDFVTVEWSDFI